MKVLISGVCGFVGSNIARHFIDSGRCSYIIGIDNFSRAGSETNRKPLQKLGVEIIRGDIRNTSDVAVLPNVDYVVDAAANPSVLAGFENSGSSRQLMEHNLWGTVNLLEYCKEIQAGFGLISTSRVYSIRDLVNLPIIEKNNRFILDLKDDYLGVSKGGINEKFSTEAPVSLYGASKLASEALVQEYSYTFDFPAWINRCGVLAGAGQFGKADQGIFSYWIHSYLQKNPLKYIGFNGSGFQCRDFFHPKDLADLLLLQAAKPEQTSNEIYNVGGGVNQMMSLYELSEWCAEFFGFQHEVVSSADERPFDIPWFVMDNRKVMEDFNWSCKCSSEDILIEIARHAKENSDWLELIK